MSEFVSVCRQSLVAISSLFGCVVNRNRTSASRQRERYTIKENSRKDRKMRACTCSQANLLMPLLREREAERFHSHSSFDFRSLRGFRIGERFKWNGKRCDSFDDSREPSKLQLYSRGNVMMTVQRIKKLQGRNLGRIAMSPPDIPAMNPNSVVTSRSPRRCRARKIFRVCKMLEFLNGIPEACENWIENHIGIKSESREGSRNCVSLRISRGWNRFVDFRS